jgi:hypothetical protein
MIFFSPYFSFFLFYFSLLFLGNCVERKPVELVLLKGGENAVRDGALFLAHRFAPRISPSATFSIFFAKCPVLGRHRVLRVHVRRGELQKVDGK